jgi:hypothetical protein
MGRDESPDQLGAGYGIMASYYERGSARQPDCSCCLWCESGIVMQAGVKNARQPLSFTSAGYGIMTSMCVRGLAHLPDCNCCLWCESNIVMQAGVANARQP